MQRQSRSEILLLLFNEQTAPNDGDDDDDDDEVELHDASKCSKLVLALKFNI